MGADWTSVAEWWRDPASAYLAGLHHGVQLERERIAAEDEALWRAAVRRATEHAERVDRRRAADAPGPRSGDYAGVG